VDANENTVLTELCECPQDACVKTGYHYADISVPVELKSNATIGDVEVECCDEPTADCRQGKCGNTCEITVRQKVSVKIPICYQVVACMGESSIHCDDCPGCCE
jgi:hypothetical protein